jgi:response regulator RpfG family c-di-GMP phosphodiesterase
MANILIVGAKEAATRYATQSLAQAAFQCTCVTAQADVRRVLSQQAMDAAVLDLSTLPFPEAVSLARWLRQEHRDLPLVVVTSSASAQFAAEVTGFGAIDYLRIPMSGEELCHAVERALQWRREVADDEATLERQAGLMRSRTAAIIESCHESGIASSAALEAWLGVLYLRDPWTAGHVSRVAYLAAHIGATLELDDEDLALVRRAALMHDIGRLAIPEELLQSPDPLTAGQQALVRRHVAVAHEIATAVPFLQPLAPILVATRERFNGSGYPNGLQGDDIPLASRIIAVAEAFDALGWTSANRWSAVDRVNAEIVRARTCASTPSSCAPGSKAWTTGFSRPVSTTWRRRSRDGRLGCRGRARALRDTNAAVHRGRAGPVSPRGPGRRRGRCVAPAGRG